MNNNNNNNVNNLNFNTNNNNNNNKKLNWEDLGISQWLINNCKQLGLKYPTEIQQNCIPNILKGRDIIGNAPTGSGKTACFTLSILHTLSLDPFGIFALILTPTRELAYQIADQFNIFGVSVGIKVEVIIGGRDIIQQSMKLSKKPHIVIATPGRLVEHIQNDDNLNFNKIKFLVLDEADRLLLNEGLSKSVKEIIQFLPISSINKRQTLLFSATMNINEEIIQQLSLHNPFFYSATDFKFDIVKTLQQQYMFMPAKVKECYLIYLLRLEEKNDEEIDEELELIFGNKKKKKDNNNNNKVDQKMPTIIVFVGKCETAQLIHETLKELGIRSVPLHSELSQQKRIKSLDSFKSGFIKVLVCTDVASRGLDIPSVGLVINFDIPKNVEDYIHRIGRTARAGRNGRSISLITQYDIKKILKIEESIGLKLEEFKANEEDILRHMNETTVAIARASLKMKEIGFSKPNKKRKKETDNKS